MGGGTSSQRGKSSDPSNTPRLGVAAEKAAHEKEQRRREEERSKAEQEKSSLLERIADLETQLVEERKRKTEAEEKVKNAAKKASEEAAAGTGEEGNDENAALGVVDDGDIKDEAAEEKRIAEEMKKQEALKKEKEAKKVVRQYWAKVRAVAKASELRQDVVIRRSTTPASESGIDILREDVPLRSLNDSIPPEYRRHLRVLLCHELKDSDAEAKTLREEVIPSLTKKLMRLGISFHAIDLRLGDQPASMQVLKLAMTEATKCVPFFIAIESKTPRRPLSAEVVTELSAKYDWVKRMASKNQASAYDFLARYFVEECGHDLGMCFTHMATTQYQETRQILAAGGVPLHTYTSTVDMPRKIVDAWMEMIDSKLQPKKSPWRWFEWNLNHWLLSAAPPSPPQGPVETELEALLSKAGTSGQLALMSGSHGAGKSVLLQSWCNSVRSKVSINTVVIYTSLELRTHNRPAIVAETIISQLHHELSWKIAPILGKDCLVAFYSLLELAASSSTIVIVIDGIDVFEKTQLDWLPLHPPKNSMIVVSGSSASDQVIDHFKSHGAHHIHVPFMSMNDALEAVAGTQFVHEQASALAKEDPEHSLSALHVAAACSVLKSAIGETRPQVVSEILRAPEPKDVFSTIFAACEQLIKLEKRPNLVRDVLCYICASDLGIYEEHLEKLLKVTWAVLSPLLSALSPFVTTVAGIVMASNPEFSVAVSEKFLGRYLKAYQTKLAMFLVTQPPWPHTLASLALHLRHTDDWNQFSTVFSNPESLVTILRSDEADIFEECWQIAAERGVTILSEVERRIKDDITVADHRLDASAAVGRFLIDVGLPLDAHRLITTRLKGATAAAAADPRGRKPDTNKGDNETAQAVLAAILGRACMHLGRTSDAFEAVKSYCEDPSLPAFQSAQVLEIGVEAAVELWRLDVAEVWSKKYIGIWRQALSSSSAQQSSEANNNNNVAQNGLSVQSQAAAGMGTVMSTSTAAAAAAVSSSLPSRASQFAGASSVSIFLLSNPVGLASALHLAARLNIQKGVFQSAKQYLTEGISLFDRNFGKSHPETLSSRTTLGQLMRKTGRFEEAERTLNTLDSQLDTFWPELAVRRSHLGKEKPNISADEDAAAAAPPPTSTTNFPISPELVLAVCKLRNEMGSLAFDQGRFQQVGDVLSDLLERGKGGGGGGGGESSASEEKKPVDAAAAAADKNSSKNEEPAKDNHDASASSSSSFLTISMQSINIGGMQIIRRLALGTYGASLVWQGQYTEAEAVLERAALIAAGYAKDRLGGCNADVLLLLAQLHLDMGDKKKISRALDQAKMSCDKLGDSQHPFKMQLFLQQARSKLSNSTSGGGVDGDGVELSPSNEAFQLCNQARQILDSRLGPDHGALWQLAAVWSQVLISDHAYNDADKLLHSAITKVAEFWGGNHVFTAVLKVQLSELCEAEGRYEEACELASSALDSFIEAVGTTSSTVGPCRVALGRVSCLQGKCALAEKCFDDAIFAMNAARWDPTMHLAFAGPMEGIAMVHTATGRYLSASKYYRRLQGLLAANLGREHPRVAMALCGLARTLTERGSFIQATKILKEVEAMLSSKAALFPSWNEKNKIVARGGENDEDDDISKLAMQTAMLLNVENPSATSEEAKNRPDESKATAMMSAADQINWSRVRALCWMEHGIVDYLRCFFHSALRYFAASEALLISSIMGGNAYHPQCQVIRFWKAKALVSLGEYQQAERILLEIEPFVEKSFGVHSSNVALLRACRASVMFGEGFYGESHSEIQAARRILSECTGPLTCWWVEMTVLYCRILLLWDKLKDASNEAETALETAKKIEGGDAAFFAVASALDIKGMIHFRLSEHLAAENALQTSSTAKEAYGEGYCVPASQTYIVLASLLSKCARFSEANDIFTKAIDFQRSLMKSAATVEKNDKTNASTKAATPNAAPSSGDRPIPNWIVCETLMARALNHLDLLRLKEGEATALEALDLLHSQVGAKHPNSALCGLILAEILTEKLLPARSGEILSEIEPIIERNFGKESANAAWCLRIRGKNSMLVLQYETALQSFQRAKDVDERILPEHHPIISEDNDLVGTANFRLGRAHNAEQAYVQAYKSFRVAYSEDHPSVARIVCRLATVLAERGKFGGAKERFIKGLQHLQKVYDPSCLRLAEPFADYANCLYHCGEYSTAEELLSRAWKIQESAVGTGHAAVSIVRMRLAAVHLAMGRLRGPAYILRSCMAVFEGMTGKSGKDSAEAMRILGVLYYVLGEFRRARCYFAMARSVFAALLGPQCVQVALCDSSLAMILLQRGQYSNSLRAFQSAKTAKVAAGWKEGEHVGFCEDLEGMALACMALGNYSQAKAHVDASISLMSTLSPENNARMAWTFTIQGCIFLDCGKLNSAWDMFQRACQWEQNLLDSNHYISGITQLHLGRWYTRTGDIHAACRCLEDSVRILSYHFKPSHIELLRSRTALAVAVAIRGQVADALKSLEEVKKTILSVLVPRLLQPSDVAHLDLARVFYTRGDILRRIGMLEAAAEETLQADELVCKLESQRDIAGLSLLTTPTAAAAAVISSSPKQHDSQSSFSRGGILSPSGEDLIGAVGSISSGTLLNANQGLGGNRAPHPFLAILRCSLAHIRSDQNRFGEAEALYRETLLILQASEWNDSKHPCLADCLLGMVTLLRRAGRFDEAQEFLAQAKIARFGKEPTGGRVSPGNYRNDPYQAVKYEAIVSPMAAPGGGNGRGNLLEGEGMNTDSQDRSKGEIVSDGGSSNVQFARWMTLEIALVRCELELDIGNLQKVRSILEDELNPFFAGPSAAILSAISARLAAKHEARNRKTENNDSAAATSSSSPDISSLAFIPPYLISRYKAVLARLYLTEGKIGDAEAAAKEATMLISFEIGAEDRPRPHPSLAALLCLRGRVLIDRGRYGEAERRLFDALSSAEQSVGERHAVSLECLILLGRVHTLKGDVSTAEKELQRCRQILLSIQTGMAMSVMNSSSNFDAATGTAAAAGSSSSAAAVGGLAAVASSSSPVLSQANNNQVLLADCLSSQAWLALTQGNPKLALQLFAEAQQVRELAGCSAESYLFASDTFGCACSHYALCRRSLSDKLATKAIQLLEKVNLEHEQKRRRSIVQLDGEKNSGAELTPMPAIPEGAQKISINLTLDNEHEIDEEEQVLLRQQQQQQQQEKEQLQRAGHWRMIEIEIQRAAWMLQKGDLEDGVNKLTECSRTLSSIPSSHRPMFLVAAVQIHKGFYHQANGDALKAIQLTTSGLGLLLTCMGYRLKNVEEQERKHHFGGEEQDLGGDDETFQATARDSRSLTAFIFDILKQLNMFLDSGSNGTDTATTFTTNPLICFGLHILSRAAGAMRDADSWTKIAFETAEVAFKGAIGLYGGSHPIAAGFKIWAMTARVFSFGSVPETCAANLDNAVVTLARSGWWSSSSVKSSAVDEVMGNAVVMDGEAQVMASAASFNFKSGRQSPGPRDVAASQSSDNFDSPVAREGIVADDDPLAGAGGAAMSQIFDPVLVSVFTAATRLNVYVGRLATAKSLLVQQYSVLQKFKLSRTALSLDTIYSAIGVYQSLSQFELAAWRICEVLELVKRGNGVSHSLFPSLILDHLAALVTTGQYADALKAVEELGLERYLEHSSDDAGESSSPLNNESASVKLSSKLTLQQQQQRSEDGDDDDDEEEESEDPVRIKSRGRSSSVVANVDGAVWGMDGEVWRRIRGLISGSEDEEKEERDDQWRKSMIRGEIGVLLLDIPALITEAKMDYDSAEKLHKRSLFAKESLLGENHVHCLRSRFYIGRVLAKLGAADEARTVLKKVLSNQESALGARHPHVAETTLALATVESMVESQFELVNMSESLYQTALSIMVDAFSAAEMGELLPHEQGASLIPDRRAAVEHPIWATASAGLAVLYHAAGPNSVHAAQVRPRIEQAIGIIERTLSPTHISLVALLLALSLVIDNGGQSKDETAHKQAALLRVRAHKILESILGADHPKVAESLLQLGDFFSDDPRECRYWLLKCLKQQEKIHGDFHPALIAPLRKLIALCMRLGEYEEAESFVIRVLEIRESVLGRGHVELSDDLLLCAHINSILEKFDNAEQLLEEARQIRTRAFGDRSLPVAEVWERFGEVHTRACRTDDAEAAYARALDIRSRHRGESEEGQRVLQTAGDCFSALLDARGKHSIARKVVAETERKIVLR